jgi:DNA (cytosine-5)-methyltransferase 1
LSGDPAPSRQKRESFTTSSEDCTDVSKCLTARGAGSQNRDPETSNLLPIALAENTIGRQPENGGNGDGFTDGGPMYTLNATGVHGVAQPIAFAFDSLSSNSMKSKNPTSGCNHADISKSLDTSRGLDPSCNQGGMAIAQPIFFEPRSPDGVPRIYPMEGAAPTLNTMGGGQREPCVTHSVAQAMAVRRLTPIECERLQGFGDNYTDIQPKGKPTPDGPRYKALGNSMAVPVMAWIGKRIQEVERLSERNG